MVGIDLLVEPASAVAFGVTLVDTATPPFGLPATPAIVGVELFAQAILLEQFGAASPAPSPQYGPTIGHLGNTRTGHDPDGACARHAHGFVHAEVIA